MIILSLQGIVLILLKLYLTSLDCIWFLFSGSLSSGDAFWNWQNHITPVLDCCLHFGNYIWYNLFSWLPAGVGGRGYFGFKVMGLIRRFFGVWNFPLQDFFGWENLASIFCGASMYSVSKYFGGYSKSSRVGIVHVLCLVCPHYYNRLCKNDEMISI